MTKPVQSLKFYKVCAVAVLLILVGVSCLPAAADVPSATPVLQTVEVTRQVTLVVTQPVTQEVTRIVEVPVPVTVTPTLTPDISPTPTLTSTITPTPTITPPPPAPRVTILVHAACYFGPGDVYLYKYGLLATSWMEVIGRNLDGTYLWVQGGDHKNPCWMRADQTQFIAGGDVNNYNIPVAYSILPYSNLYRPPTGVQAFRSGNKVTVAWNAVWMTEDDYEGYLIEAWLCHDGQQVFTPIKHKLPMSQNIEGETQYEVLTDESGCLVPSSARIYTAEKHGYTGFIVIPWPPYDTALTPTP